MLTWTWCLGFTVPIPTSTRNVETLSLLLQETPSPICAWWRQTWSYLRWRRAPSLRVTRSTREVHGRRLTSWDTWCRIVQFLNTRTSILPGGIYTTRRCHSAVWQTAHSFFAASLSQPRDTKEVFDTWVLASTVWSLHPENKERETEKWHWLCQQVCL